MRDTCCVTPTLKRYIGIYIDIEEISRDTAIEPLTSVGLMSSKEGGGSRLTITHGTQLYINRWKVLEACEIFWRLLDAYETIAMIGNPLEAIENAKKARENC